MRRPILALTLLTAFVATPGMVPAQALRGDERIAASTDSFLGAHPDLQYRLSGLDAHDRGDYADALYDFRRAARYADKMAQSMLGEMHWRGLGTPVDRGLAYVWMDLAAERGYPLLLAKREHYWESLDETERARALALGEGMYAEFGDEAAKPRMARHLKLARRHLTGSRVGSFGPMVIRIRTAKGIKWISGDDYYNDKFWEPNQYFRWHDSEWLPPAQGTVEVGEVSPGATPTPDPED